LGVIIFQLLVGRTPFKAPSPYLSFLRIKRCHLLLPKVLSPSASDLISRLVVFGADERLGIKGSLPGDLSSIKAHPFFAQIGCEFEKLFLKPATRIPRLSELSLRSCARACVADSSHNKEWNKRLLELSEGDRQRVMHYLSRVKSLHEPRVLRRFFSSLADTRCLGAQTSIREMRGLEHEEQGKWKEPFVMVHVNISDLLSCWGEVDQPSRHSLKLLVTTINRLRPRVCFFGVGDGMHELSESSLSSFRQACARVSETIPLAFISAPRNSHFRARHERSFGADYYGLWYGGVRVLVLNSGLIVDDKIDPAATLAQESWFDGEVEQGQLGGHHLLVFSNHLWFTQDPREESEVAIPRHTRLRWLQKLKIGKVRAVFTGSQAATNTTNFVDFSDLVVDDTVGDSDSASEDENHDSAQTVEVVNTGSAAPGLRVISCFEHRLEHRFFETSEVPDRTVLLRSA
jgi:hypothetical protein